MARALKTSVSYFYEGLSDGVDGSGVNLPRESFQDFLLTPEGMELAAIFPKIRAPRVRRRMLELVRTIAEEAEATVI